MCCSIDDRNEICHEQEVTMDTGAKFGNFRTDNRIRVLYKQGSKAGRVAKLFPLAYSIRGASSRNDSWWFTTISSPLTTANILARESCN